MKRTTAIFSLAFTAIALLASCASARQSSGTEANAVSAGVPVMTLSGGFDMPQFGIGTFAQGSDEVCRASVLAALQSGYRHIDTAHFYGVERGVGQAVKESGIPREKIWITSKLWPTEYDDAAGAIDRMLSRLGTDYVDLLYVHQAVGNYMDAWRAMEKAVADGKVRALGISNFDYSDEALDEIMTKSKIKPAIIQLELHPYAQRVEARKKAAKYGLAVEGWFPLGHGDSGLLSDPVLSEIATAHSKTVAQVILRWHIQEGFSVIPGSKNPMHIEENISIFDFALTDDEMRQIRSLNREQRFFTLNFEQVKDFSFGVKLED